MDKISLLYKLIPIHQNWILGSKPKDQKQQKKRKKKKKKQMECNKVGDFVVR